ncbi:protein YqhG of unknown function [Amphibacillus marinus]|uniref:YqhG n=1 Tax=Amphibacillus marinus TaxID=872970 RepID=A0A1H8NMQ7_9BACI|nr:YqhG family protein [Amphibacillus marinus]SEO30884.1 protein YqhG of unknown function [Amphibacillus marinus]
MIGQVQNMEIENLHNFLIDYFSDNKCEVDVDQQAIHVQLTDEMDEKLMNRPFYWQYVKKLNQVGQPMKVSFTTQFELASKDVQYIYLGTERFKTICLDVLEKGKFTSLYQKTEVAEQTPLYPWFIINLKLTFVGKTKHESLFSFGINLINGVIIDQAITWLKEKEWTGITPDFCYSITPLITLNHAFLRIEHYILEKLQHEQHSWAEQSYHEMSEELKLLEYFYQRNPNLDQQQYEKEKQNIQVLFQPKISFEIVNGGLFYTAEKA